MVSDHCEFCELKKHKTQHGKYEMLHKVSVKSSK